MQQYLDLLQHIKDHGVQKDDRTGTGTISTFGYQMRMDLNEWFPLLTTKKVYLKAIIHELLWFLTGDTNIKYLVRNNVRIRNERAFSIYLEATWLDKELERYSDDRSEKLKWFVKQIKDDDEFANKWWDLGPVYGKQRREREANDGSKVDQIANVIDMLKTNPNSRRILVSGRNIGEIMRLIKNKNTAPPPCHTLFQFYVAEGKLSCQLYQRSADVFLWVPFNIASYSLLTMMIAQVCNLELGEFIHTFGDVHIYSNHIDQVNEQLSRKPRILPTMKINPEVRDIFHFKYKDFTIEWYDPHPPIKAPIAV